MITVRTSPQYVNRVRQDWTDNGGVYGDGGVYMATSANNPFAQLGPTLDLTFAGVPTDQFTAATTDGYSVNLNLSSDIYQIAAQYAVWGADGLQQVNFSQVITFTRASTATFVGSDGLIQSAAIDAPRFDYDPVTLAAKGLLIEESRANLLLQSETFTTTWLATAAATFTKNATSPDGTANATSVVEDTTTAQRVIRQDVTSTGSNTHSFTIYAKPLGAGSQRWLGIRLANAASSTTNYIQAVFDLTNGTAAGTGSLGDGTFTSASAVAAGNGWYRCQIIGIPSASATSVRSSLSLSTSSTVWGPSYTGDGVSGLILWGAQLEVGLFPTSYIPTTTTSLTRSQDVAQVNTLSPWFNATEGTLYGQATVSSAVLANRAITSLTQSVSAAQDIALLISRSADSRRLASISNVTSQFTFAPAGTVTTTKGALAYKTNDSQAAFDGAASLADTLVTLPTATAVLRIGNDDSGAQHINGHIQRITYYPRRLSEAELVSITT